MAQAAQKKDSKQVVVELTMTLEEARQVIWRGRGNHEPMGKLLDAKAIDRGDLAWAVDVGREPDFREAARTLLAYSIGQPVTLRYGPEVIEGSHYLKENVFERYGTLFFYAGFALAAGILIVTLLIQQLLSGNLGAFLGGLVGTLIFGSLLAWEIFRRMRKEFDEYKNFQQGLEGEEKIVERLRTSLDNRWTIFRNLHLPGHDDDIDIVLVGPGGVWAVEAKSSRYTVRVEGKKWKTQTKTGWVDAPSNPSLQVTKDAMQLRKFFIRQGFDRWVECAVALAEPQLDSNFADSEIPIWLLSTIEEQAKNLPTRTLPMESEISKIVEILKDLATKQIAIEESKS